jgi:signal transduction histidine kinase
MIRLFQILLPALLVLLLIQPLNAAEAKEPKRVLILYSEDKAHPAHELTDQGIREAFSKNKLFDVQLYAEYLDVSRFGSPFHAHAMADLLRRKYSGMGLHAIIAVYPYALDFLLAEKDTLPSEVPIVAAEISRAYAEDLERSPARRFVTGTVMGENITGLIDGALRLRPQTMRVALIAGTTANSAYIEEVFRRGLNPYEGRIELIDLTKLHMQKILTRVSSLPPDAILLYSGISRDGAGQNFLPREALSLIARAATVPAFGLYESFLGYGIVGGQLVSIVEHGKESAALALRIMAGESPASIPFGGEQAYVSAYDWRELERWKIPEADLPAGSEVRYRIPSFWEEHRGPIIGAVSLVILETALILGLLINFSRRRRAEHSLREHENELRTLTGRLIYTQEEELRRLSRELHDDLTQRLAALALDAALIEKQLDPVQPKAVQDLKDLRANLTEVADEVHNLSRQLHPSILDDLGLVQAVEAECAAFTKKTGIDLSFVPHDVPNSIPQPLALCLYRVIRESLQNIAKHSGAAAASVTLQGLSDGIRLLIQDKGVGFDSQEVKKKAGIGLSSMRERVRIVNGTIAIESKPGKGTELQVFIPLGGGYDQGTAADR